MLVTGGKNYILLLRALIVRAERNTRFDAIRNNKILKCDTTVVINVGNALLHLITSNETHIFYNAFILYY